MRESRKTILAFTLTEMLVAMAIMVILMAVAIPAVKKLSASMEQSGGVKTLIEAALSNARAVAVREQKYAGVRFQQYEGRQYLMVVINDPNGTGYVNGFRVVDGRKPMVLPENTAIISDQFQTDPLLGVAANLKQAISASIIFTPTGSMTTHDVWFKDNVQFGKTIFLLNDGANFPSVNSFRVYDLKAFAEIPSTKRWSYLSESSSSEHISPYTGELIKKN